MLVSSSTTSTIRVRYSMPKLSMRGCRSTICREGRTGQKAEEDDDGGDDGDAVAEGSVAADWLSAPNGLV